MAGSSHSIFFAIAQAIYDIDTPNMQRSSLSLLNHLSKILSSGDVSICRMMRSQEGIYLHSPIVMAGYLDSFASHYATHRVGT